MHSLEPIIALEGLGVEEEVMQVGVADEFERVGAIHALCDFGLASLESATPLVLGQEMATLLFADQRERDGGVDASSACKFEQCLALSAFELELPIR